jgi:hypothetical protein
MRVLFPDLATRNFVISSFDAGECRFACFFHGPGIADASMAA